MRLAAAVCVPLVFAALPAKADDFCETLQAIVASVPNDFAEIRGTKSYGGLAFPEARILPGARASCQVYLSEAGSNRYPPSYSCEMSGDAGWAAKWILAAADCYGLTTDQVFAEGIASKIREKGAEVSTRFLFGPDGQGPGVAVLRVEPLKALVPGAQSPTDRPPTGSGS